MDEDSLFAVVLITRHDGTRETVRIIGGGSPDMALIDALARMKLVESRRGSLLRLVEVSDSLKRMIELAGLSQELEGESECGEKHVGVQE
jgi:hypothetical protein